jgi:hypothetical protein
VLNHSVIPNDDKHFEIVNFTLHEIQPYDLNFEGVGNAVGMKLLIPEYQREFVWEEDRYIDYINSVVTAKLPLEPIYLQHALDERNRVDLAKNYIIDGKHRVKAIIRMFNNDLPIFGYYWKDIQPRDQMFIKMKILPHYYLWGKCSSIQAAELYIMVNFTKIPHTAQDKQKALAYIKQQKEHHV